MRTVTDLSVRLLLESGLFRGSVRVCVGDGDWERFLAAIIRCERERRGQAGLESTFSPDEARLILEPSDSLGHFRVRYELSERDSRDGEGPTTLTGSFALNVEYFTAIVQQVRRMQEWTQRIRNSETVNTPA